MHEARRNGELTSDDINAIWLNVQAESLGPAVDLKGGYDVFWAYIPHFIHSPFYVYAYFVAKYFELLKAGGAKHHSELLAPFGLDARQPEFWNKGLKVIEGMIDELQSMD